MKKHIVLAAALSFTAAAHSADVAWDYSLSPVYVPSTDLDSGGQVQTTWLMGSLGATKQIDQHQRLGLSLSASQQQWRFDAPKAWRGKTPWQDLYRMQLSLPYSYATASAWIFSFSPGVEYSGEDGADFGESTNYGATTFVANQVSPSLLLGLGLSAWQGAKENKVFPFLVVNWKVSDTLTLKNPYVAGPVGPAGLELAWKMSPKWELSAGGAMRSYETRLANANSVAANGSLEINTLPVFISANYAFTPDTSLKLYAGAALNGEFVINNQQGNELVKETYSTMPFLSVTLSGKF